MSNDSWVGGEIWVRRHARPLSPAHSQKIKRGHNILKCNKTRGFRRLMLAFESYS